MDYFVRTKVATGNGIATVYRLKLFNCAKDCMGKFSSSWNIQKSENRLDVGKRSVLLRSDLQNLRARELGRTANYNLQRSGKNVKKSER